MSVKLVKGLGVAVGMAGIWSLASAATVNVDVTEEHQVIRGFGGMVHNQWQGGGGLSEADAKLAFGTGDGQIGLNTLRIPVYANSSDFNKEVQAAKYAKAVAGDDFILYATPWTSPYAGANQHMASSNYQKYVDHLNSFNDYMKNQGVPLYAISISNEPDWCHEWACWSADEIYNFTKGYADKMRKNGVKVISTESFAYQKNLYDKVLNDANAMDVAYEIHRAMVVGNFNQYTWWYIRRCYGLIMEKDFGNKLNIPQNEIGKVSKRGYVMSQFARFIRPGAVRVGATAKPEANLFASAYKSADGDSVIVVLVNRDYKNDKEVTVKVQGADVQTFHVYTTSETKNAKDEGEVEVVNGSVTVKMTSGGNNFKDCIVTLVGVGTPADPIPREPFGGKVAEIPGKIEAENFDVPGTGKGNKSYYENDSENHGDSEYREGTGVDLYKKATGVIVGYNQEGEWLEYSVNVKEAGDYTMFASVAAGGNTGSFQMALDGENITEALSVPAASQGSGENFDEYNLVKANVTLPAGEHILRMTVMGNWFDVDYFNFLKGKDASIGDTSTTIVNTRFQVAGAQNYRIFDMNGGYIGMVRATGMQELKNATAGIVKCGGAYLAKSMNGRTKLIQVTK